MGNHQTSSPVPVGVSSPIHFIPAPAQPHFSSTTPPAQIDIPVQSKFDWKRFATPLVEIYAAGVGLMLLRLSLAIHGGRKLRSAAQPLTDPSILDALHRQAARLGLRFAPAASFSTRVLVPTVVGILRPAILLPVSISTGLSLEAIEAILAQELAHIRRFDHLFQLLQRLIEAVFFFHPAIWYLTRRVHAERENACDDLALQAVRERRDYANALLQAAELCILSRRAGAVASLAMADRPGGLRQRIARLIEPATDSRFRLPGVCTASFLLILAAILALSLRPHATAAAPATQPTYTLTGTISDDQGRPIRNAMVAPIDENLWQGVTTDHEGKFSLKNLRSDQVQFFAYSQHRRLMTAFTTDPTTKDLRPIVLDCLPAHVKGRVVTSAGLPIASAHIDLHLTAPDQTVYTIPMQDGNKTDDSGQYGIATIPAGPGFSVTASLRGELGKDSPTPAVALGRQYLVEIPDLVTDALPAAPKPGPAPIRYSGRILDQETNQPIAGVRADLAYPGNGGTYEIGTVLTDADGKWSCLGPPDLQRIEIRLDHSDFIGNGFDLTRMDTTPIQAMRDGSAVQYMKRGQRITGHVLDPDGKPLWNALVLAGKYYSTTGRENEAIEDSTAAHTDRDGSFSIGGIPLGKQQLVVTSENMAPTFFPLLISTQNPPVTVSMEAGHTMTGRVIDETGNPIASAHINIGGWTPTDAYRRPLPQTAMTDSDGHFQLTDLPRQGLLELYAGFKGRLGAEAEVASSASDVGDITLCSLPHLAGTVVDDATGQPIQNFEAKLGYVEDDGRISYSSVDKSTKLTGGTFDLVEDSYMIDRDGRTRFAAQITAKDYAPEVTPFVTARIPSKPMTIRLKKAQSITGTVVDDQNAPVAGAEVFWVGPTNDTGITGWKIEENYSYKPELRTKSDAAGKFDLPSSSEPGRILALDKTGYALLASADYHSGSPLKLNAWAKVEGNYVPNGKPVAGIQILLESPPISSDPTKRDHLSFQLNTITDAQGHFVIENVPSFPMRLEAYATYGPAASANVEPQRGQTLQVDLGQGGVPVTGRIDLSKIIAVNPPPPGTSFDTSTSWIRAVQIDPAPQPPAGADAADWNSQLAAVLNGTATEDLSIPAHFADLQPDGSFSFVGLSPGKYELLAIIHGERPANTCGWGLVLGRASAPFTVASATQDLPPLTPDAIPHPSIGSAAPEITGKDSTGNNFTLSSLRGKYVVLDFWAGWCAPCRASLPLLQEIYRKHATANVAFVGLNYDYTPAAANAAITTAATPGQTFSSAPGTATAQPSKHTMCRCCRRCGSSIPRATSPRKIRRRSNWMRCCRKGREILKRTRIRTG